MVDADRGAKLVIVIFVAALMAAFLLPIAIGAIAGPDELTTTQGTGTANTTQLGAGLNATVTGVTSGTSATYEIQAENGATATTTVNVGANDTVTVDGADVTISPSSVTSTEATTTYQYPTTYGWGSGAGALWGIIPVMMVLAVFLYFVTKAVGYY